MPISFQPLSATDSAATSVRSEPFLSPPMSHSSLDDVPFKAEGYDRVSLSMKKAKGHPHGLRPGLPRRKYHSDQIKVLGTKGRKTGSRRDHSPRSLRKARSLPLIQPRFDPGIVTLLPSPKRKTRRWTVPSKAGSTRGLATIVPAQPPANKADERLPQRVKSSQSPAMITLRRATTSGSQRRASLTSFPTPKFSRGGSGFLSSLLQSITGQDGPPVDRHTMSQPANRVTQASRSASIISDDEVHIRTSAIAPPVRTEVVTIEPRLSLPGSDQAVNPDRRCSTRYVSDNAVYEIIWDENWSSASSEGVSSSPRGNSVTLGGRGSTAADTLERRLSNALYFTAGVSNRRTSYVPDSTSETFFESLTTTSKLARLFREPGFAKALPRSRASRKREILTRMAAQLDFEQHTLAESSPPENRATTVDFFPPLRSRANSCGSNPFLDKVMEPRRESLDAHEQGQLTGRSRYGSMVGISSHARRLSLSPDPPQAGGKIKGTKHARRAGSNSRKRHRDSDEETVPLLVTL